MRACVHARCVWKTRGIFTSVAVPLVCNYAFTVTVTTSRVRRNERSPRKDSHRPVRSPRSSADGERDVMEKRREKRINIAVWIFRNPSCQRTEKERKREWQKVSGGLKPLWFQPILIRFNTEKAASSPDFVKIDSIVEVTRFMRILIAIIRSSLSRMISDKISVSVQLL